MHSDRGGLKERPARGATSTAAFVIASLLAVAVLGWLSLVTQPAALASTAWWPVAGIALGLGLRFPRRHTWLLAGAVTAITVPLPVAGPARRAAP